MCKTAKDTFLGNSLSTATERPERVDAILKTPFHHDNLDMLEYPFLTMSTYPQGFILHLGEKRFAARQHVKGLDYLSIFQ